MRFNDIHISCEERFCVGFDAESEKYYLSIPVRVGLCDAEELYEITKEEVDKFETDFAYLKNLARKCRERKNDARLYYQPGKVRGEPC